MTKNQFRAYTRDHLIAALNLINDHIYTVVAPLEISAWRTTEPVRFGQRQSGEELNLMIGDSWGKLFDCAWFRFRGVVPPQAAGMPVVLLLDVNGELCVVDDKGVPLRGLTNVASEYDYRLGRPGKRVLPIFDAAVGGESIEVWADAGCNDLFGRVQENATIKEAYIAVCSPEVRGLYYDFEVLLDSLKVLPESSARHQRILTALNDATHTLMSGLAIEQVVAARQVLGRELSVRGGDPVLRVSAVGHAHMDLAWLWPVRETKRKGARTFATALANMERYPDYIFAASQAQLFQWMKEDYPELYARICQKVAERRIEPQGALWVECDTNVTGGESLVRQILYGRRFFRAEFGVDPRYVWLPDTFGYSAALPQIMYRAGIDAFSTQKLSWSLINRFPHQSFQWVGLDGSQVLVHMLPEETYNSPAAPRAVSFLETNYRDSGISGRALMAYGIGDGGGGPGEEHLERLERIKNFAGLAPVCQEWTADFLNDWAKDAERFACWSGELYLERHQGTLTTNARNKWFNRRMEGALRELEWLSCVTSYVTGNPYPGEMLERVWKEVLLYQFHDILPGSSIKRVYDETTARYTSLLAEVEAAIAQAQEGLAGAVARPGGQPAVMVFNSLNWERRQWLKLEGGWQKVEVPGMGWCLVDLAPTQDWPAVRAETGFLENDYLRVQFAPNGAIESVYDLRAQREVVQAGEQANRLVVYNDYGDAWDFPMDYADSQPRQLVLVANEAYLDGPRAVMKQTYAIGGSRLVQEISLTAGSARLEFDTHLIWREPRSMLRVQFPVAVRADQAVYDIQFGQVRRPTHTNTSWDLARDEVAGQKWVDLSERDYGVALLNDSKYGHRVKGQVIDLNLLRSVPYPGPKLVNDDQVKPGEPHHAYTDQCEHRFRYALYPHSGDAVAGGVVQEGYAFNLPLRTCPVVPTTGMLPAKGSNVQVLGDGIILEGIKQAEDRVVGNHEWILRLYEAAGCSVPAVIKFSFPIAHAALVNLMEEEGQALEVIENGVKLDFRPYEIKTLRVVLSPVAAGDNPQ